MKAVRFIHNHPALISGGAAALLAWRRKGIVGLTEKAWRMLYLYPAAISLGLKYLFSALSSPSEERNSEVDH
jgi:hypothetical protein